MSKDSVVLLGCGDVGPIHEPVAHYSSLVRDTLAQADLRFAQLERIYSTRGQVQARCWSGHARIAPEMSSVLSDCKFDLVSFASNHSVDYGADALLDTLEVIRSRGGIPFGAGKDLQEATAPVFVERNGVRIAFLAFCSLVHPGYAAAANKPGIAPLRVHTIYEPLEEGVPGLPAAVMTRLFEDDLKRMVELIAAAKKEAHCVVLSLHWGVPFISRVIADYQWAARKAAFDAGADVIFGHHAHIPKGIDVYKGKVCFFSLSNFIMTMPEQSPERAATFNRLYNPFGVTLDPDPAYGRLAYGLDAKRSLIAKIVLSRDGVRKVSFLPVEIDRELRPEVLRNGDDRFHDLVAYMDRASEGFNYKFTVEGDEVVITG